MKLLFNPPALLRALLIGAALAYAPMALAQVEDSDIPPPPEGDTSATATGAPAAPAAAPAVAAPAVAAPVPAAAPVVEQEKPLDTAQAAQQLNSAHDAYQFELKRVKDKKKSVEDKSSAAEKDLYGVWNKLQGITQYPSVSIHGVGRAMGFSRQYSGSNITFSNPGLRVGEAYLDLMPMGSVSKQVRWSGLVRFLSNIQTGTASESMQVMRATLEFNPEWISATVGDFDEAYTPFTLWNRSTLDLKYAPEMVARWDDYFKYRTFLNNEPAFPFRGIKIGTAIGWPDSPLFEKFEVSSFAHMIRNGYNTTSNGQNFFGPYQFTDWVFAGKTSLKLKKWRLGALSIQAQVDAFGYILDQWLDSDTPGTAYDPINVGTWAHQYRVGSWKPSLRFGLGGDIYVGGEMELAYAAYEDDKLYFPAIGQGGAGAISDYAVQGGPYVQIGESRVSLNFLDVGPNYYSPLAQIRQDAVTTLASGFDTIPSADIYRPLFKGQNFITRVLRPSGYLDFYDRRQDEVFPYGLATPNRLGIGIDLDVQALEKKALKIKGSAYFVNEMSGNLVVNSSASGYASVEDPSAVYEPKRNFLYINVGPSIDLGPLLGWDRVLEIGCNIREERADCDWQSGGTTSSLESLSKLFGIRVGVLACLELSASYGNTNTVGQEFGHSGTTWARYSYQFDNTDLGSYQLVDMTGFSESYRFSGVFKIDRHSRLSADFSMVSTNQLPYFPTAVGRLNNQFMGLTYEIEF